jgi:hypothetical protein
MAVRRRPSKVQSPRRGPLNLRENSHPDQVVGSLVRSSSRCGDTLRPIPSRASFGSALPLFVRLVARRRPLPHWGPSNSGGLREGVLRPLLHGVRGVGDLDPDVFADASEGSAEVAQMLPERWRVTVFGHGQRNGVGAKEPKTFRPGGNAARFAFPTVTTRRLQAGSPPPNPSLDPPYQRLSDRRDFNLAESPGAKAHSIVGRVGLRWRAGRGSVGTGPTVVRCEVIGA